MPNSALDNLPALNGTDIADDDKLYISDASEAGIAKSKYVRADQFFVKTRSYTDALYATIGHLHTGVYSPVGHTHIATDIVSGIIPPARLGSGTPNSTTYLRGDSTWQPIASGASTLDDLTDVVITSATRGDVLRHNGTTFRNAPDKVINVKDYGAIGDGTADDTTAIQAALTALLAGTNVALNPTLYFPHGRYKITATLTSANNVSYFTLAGDGARSSMILWNGTAGQPMFKGTNCRGAMFEKLGWVIGSAKPSYCLQFDRTTAGSGAAPMYITVRNCLFGGDSASATAVGIGFTASAGYDANNEQALIEQCEFTNCDRGIRIEHSNALWHKIIACDFESCTAGISNYMSGGFGGGFSAIGCNFAATAKPIELGASRYPVTIIGCNSEGSDWAIYTPDPISTGYGGLHIIGGLWYVGSGIGTSGIKWDCNSTDADARLVLDNVMLLGPSGCRLDFPGRSQVYIRGGSYNFAPDASSFKYAGKVFFEDIPGFSDMHLNSTVYATDSAGNAANPVLVIRQTGQRTSPFTFPTPSSGTIDIKGFPVYTAFSFAAGPTTVSAITGGYEGQEITILAGNGNLTLQNAAGLVLQGAVNFTMATGNTIKLQNINSIWYEVSRKT